MSSVPDVVVIDDLDSFVKALNQWHTAKVATLQHMLTIPEGTTVEVPGEAPLSLSGDVKRAFNLGITLSLMELGELPFYTDGDGEAPAEGAGALDAVH